MINTLKKIYKRSFVYKSIEKIINTHFQKELKNNNFTILCPNCIGGVIYNRLGKRFDSPTVNLTINTDDFSCFLENMEYYLSQPVFDNGRNKYDLPVGVIRGTDKIPDIEIVFTHYKTFEQGCQKWNERKTRIHRENTYVIMYDINDLDEANYRKAGFASEDAIKRLDNFKCKNKILLTRNKNCQYPNAYFIKPKYKEKNPLVYLTRNIFGLNRFEYKWDFVNFLNN